MVVFLTTVEQQKPARDEQVSEVVLLEHVVVMLCMTTPLVWRSLRSSERKLAEAAAKPRARRVRVLNMMIVDLSCWLFIMKLIIK